MSFQSSLLARRRLTSLLALLLALDRPISISRHVWHRPNIIIIIVILVHVPRISPIRNLDRDIRRLVHWGRSIGRPLRFWLTRCVPYRRGGGACAFSEDLVGHDAWSWRDDAGLEGEMTRRHNATGRMRVRSQAR